MRAVFFDVCQRLTVVSYCMPGLRNARWLRRSLEQVFGFVSVDHSSIDDGAGGEIGIARDGYHEVVGYAHGVIGVLKEDGAIGVGIGMRSVVALGHERVALASSLTCSR